MKLSIVYLSSIVFAYFKLHCYLFSEIGDRQFEADRFNSDDQVLGAAGQNSADNHRKTNRKRPRTTKSSTQVLDPVPGKPSFPTKKRVHVAHYPLPETPVQPAKVEGRVTSTLDKLQDHSGLLKDKPVLSEQGLVRSPFFWLREDEDVEKSSQQSDADIYTTPPNIPTFSDIKDSDDRNSHQLSPEVSSQFLLNNVNNTYYSNFQNYFTAALLYTSFQHQ